MSEHGRGTFSCRIDGRAGYLRLWDDRLELIRSGRRGPQVLGPEVIPLHQITAVSTGRPGRLFTAVELVAAGGYLELKMPSIDAPRVAELIAVLASEAPVPAEAYVPLPVAEPADMAEYVEPAYMAEYVEPAYMAEYVEPVYVADNVETEYATPEYVQPESLMADFEMPDFSMKVDMPEWTPLAEDEAALVIPPVEMPQWTPLPETDLDETELPEMVLSQIVLDELTPDPEPVEFAASEPVTEIEPLPDGSVLAAAAALAELEQMLNEIPSAPPGAVVNAADEMVADAREILALTEPTPEGSDGASIPAQPSEAVLTLAAAALLGGARAEAPPEPAPRPERPADLPPELARRLTGLEVLRSSGIMSEEDFLTAEAELLENASESQTA